MEEEAQAVGTVTFEIRGKDGQIIRQETARNLIVNGGRNALARLMSGDASKQVASFAVGTSGTAASLLDTALAGAFSNALTGVSYPATGKATYTWILDFADANGIAIREIGLLCAESTLFSRKVTDVIEKTADIQISGTWSFQF